MGEPRALQFVPDAREEQWPRNPLIAAVVWQLPAVGQSFSSEQRSAWLKMMATAFDVAYGPVGDGTVIGRILAALADEQTPALVSAPTIKNAGHAGHSFYIGADGTACNVVGEPVLMDDVPADEMIFDYRPVTGDFRDTAAILWADGARGIKGIAGGVSFCGPG